MFTLSVVVLGGIEVEVAQHDADVVFVLTLCAVVSGTDGGGGPVHGPRRRPQASQAAGNHFR